MNEQEYREFARINFVPIVRPKTSEILIEKIKEINPKNILEIGTAIGYSGLLMLNNSSANLVTLEKDEKMFNLAIQNFEKEGVSDRVNMILGDCKDYIEKEVGKFDFIFLDGPKSHYVEYLPHLVKMLNKGGMIFCDNVLFQGLVKCENKPPKKFRTIVNNLRKFLEIVENDKMLNSQVLDIEDGVCIIKMV